MCTTLTTMAAIALTGCGAEPAGTPNPSGAGNSMTAAASPAPRPSVAPTAAPSIGECGDTLTGEIDSADFMAPFSPDAKPLKPAQLDPLTATITQRVHDAARQLCAANKLSPDTFASFKRLRIVNAAGAAEPHFYPDPASRDVLVLEYAFDLPVAAPPTGQLSTALQCWAHPTAPGCETDGD